MGKETYKFKWSNVELADFISERKFIASDLRLQARILCIRADQIEEEIAKWESALEIIDDANPDTQD